MKVLNLCKKILWLIILVALNPVRLLEKLKLIKPKLREKIEEKKEEKLIEFIEKNNNSFNFSGLKKAVELNPKKTVWVLQTNIHIIENPERTKAIYTHGVNACTVLIAKEKKGKKIKKIGLAHLGNFTREKDIKKFIEEFHKPELFIVSAGTKEFLVSVLDCVGENHKKISLYFKAKKESKGLGIDGKGKIYYGNNIYLLYKNINLLYKYNRIKFLFSKIKLDARVLTTTKTKN